MVYPALLPPMRTPRLPVVDWTDGPTDLNGLVRFAERWNLVSARVPSHFKLSLLISVSRWVDSRVIVRPDPSTPIGYRLINRCYLGHVPPENVFELHMFGTRKFERKNGWWALYPIYFITRYVGLKNRDSVVDVGCGLDLWGVGFRWPTVARDFSLSQSFSHHLWDPTSFMFSAYRKVFSRG
jgi:hypothetical protein